jgi:hypothetical protein
MLQLLNSHCTVIRHQLERDSATGAFFFAPPPYTSLRPAGRQHPSFYGEQEIYLEDQDGRLTKRIKREATTPSEFDSDLLDGNRPRSRLSSRKPGRPPLTRKPLQRDEGPSFGPPKAQGPIYRPTMQFPPADWVPPESFSEAADANGTSAGCPSSETGESKRRHTRYQTLDYEHAAHSRVEAWKPEGEEAVRQLGLYRDWEERMAQLYGPDWEQDIGRVETGTPFE